jgi:hypothetical protein
MVPLSTRRIFYVIVMNNALPRPSAGKSSLRLTLHADFAYSLSLCFERLTDIRRDSVERTAGLFWAHVVATMPHVVHLFIPEQD